MENSAMSKRFISLIMLSLFMIPIRLDAGITIEGPLTHERIVQPGESFRGTIAIRNTGERAAEVKVYRTDYSFAADGRNDYGPPGRLVRSNADWLHLGREQITVAARSLVNLNYELRVADDATLNGTYWSMVMVEPVSARESTLDPREGEVHAQLTQVMRYAIQMVTHISDSGSRALAFSDPQLVKTKGQRLFNLDVENTGERWLRPQLWLELFDRNGRPVGKFGGAQKRIYPATSVRYQTDLSEVPIGRYRMLIVADGGGNDLFGSQIELNIE
jgi:hypothetical protein